MKKLLILPLFLFVGCTKTTTSTLSPIADAGCVVETAVTSGIAGSVATALTCTSVSAIQTSLQAALGNVNLCKTATTAQATAASAKVVTSKGLVGNIACPLAVNTVIGYLTNSIPTAWGCSAGATAASLELALTVACEAAIPL